MQCQLCIYRNIQRTVKINAKLKCYISEARDALLLDGFHHLEEVDVVQRVRVLDEAAHQQVEVLGRHNDADVVQDALEVGERNAAVVLRHLRVYDASDVVILYVPSEMHRFTTIDQTMLLVFFINNYN